MVIRRRDIDQPLLGKRHHGCGIGLIIPEVIGDTKSSPDHQCRHRQSVPQQCPEIRLYEIAYFPVTCLHGGLNAFLLYFDTYLCSMLCALTISVISTCNTAPCPHLCRSLHSLWHYTVHRSRHRLQWQCIYSLVLSDSPEYILSHNS